MNLNPPQTLTYTITAPGFNLKVNFCAEDTADYFAGLAKSAVLWLYGLVYNLAIYTYSSGYTQGAKTKAALKHAMHTVLADLGMILGEMSYALDQWVTAHITNKISRALLWTTSKYKGLVAAALQTLNPSAVT